MSDITEWTGEVHQGDSQEMLTHLPTNSVDLIVTDPPYNLSTGQENIEGLTGIGRRGEDGGVLHNNYGAWDEDEIMPGMWIAQAERVLKEEGVLISFYDALKMDDMKEVLEEVGFEFFSKYYWTKPNPAPRIRANILMPAVEEAWMAARGGGQSHYINSDLKQRRSTVDAIPPAGKEHTTHPTQKPVSVIKEFARYHCPPDGVLLDPFLGSGTTAVAAEKAGRDWIGFERDEEYVEMAQDRLRSETYHDGGNALEAEW